MLVGKAERNHGGFFRIEASVNGVARRAAYIAGLRIGTLGKRGGGASCEHGNNPQCPVNEHTFGIPRNFAQLKTAPFKLTEGNQLAERELRY